MWFEYNNLKITEQTNNLYNRLQYSIAGGITFRAHYEEIRCGKNESFAYKVSALINILQCSPSYKFPRYNLFFILHAVT